MQELPPNGQGIATLIALGILEQCGIEKHHPDSVQSLHLSIEAMKLALADLDRYVADEDHMAFAVTISTPKLVIPTTDHNRNQRDTPARRDPAKAEKQRTRLIPLG